MIAVFERAKTVHALKRAATEQAHKPHKILEREKA
jgi:hypothetical protein